jgi:hypothetical protein
VADAVPTPTTPKERIIEFVKSPTGVLTIAGIVLFSIRYAGYVLFYSSFGVSPSEVGLGWSEALVQTILTTTAWVGFGGAVFAVLCVLVLIVGLPLGAIVVAVVLVGAGVLVVVDFGRGLTEEAPSGVSDEDKEALAGATGHRVRILWREAVDDFNERVRHAIARVRPIITWLSRKFPLAGLVGAIAGLALLQCYSLVGGVFLGNRAEDGHPLAEAELLRIPLSEWRAERVNVGYSDGGNAPRLRETDCVLYLGKAEGTAVLWNHTTRRTLRVPESALALSAGKQDSC